jgi:hypothetical protein
LEMNETLLNSWIQFPWDPFWTMKVRRVLTFEKGVLIHLSGTIETE